MDKNQEPVTQTEEKIEENVAEEKEEKKATKTYTQEEYNALDKKLKAKYEKKYEGIDIAKYKEWQDKLIKSRTSIEANKKRTNSIRNWIVNNPEQAKEKYAQIDVNHTQCVACGKCKEHCPQSIDIPKMLSETISSVF